jgi:hypothetical protein
MRALHALAERTGLMDIANQAVPKRNGLPARELVFIMAADRNLGPWLKSTVPE